MTLFFPGESKCVLCSKVIEKDDKMRGFPAFLPFDHKYGKFSDTTMHESCYTSDTDHDIVEDILWAYHLTLESLPKGLKTIEEINAATQEAFKDWPPKNGVVIFHSFADNPEGENFYMDADQYANFCEAEDKANKEMEARYEEARKIERESRKYIRD